MVKQKGSSKTNRREKSGPRKALSTYLLFSMSRREEILKEKPHLKSNVTEISKIIGAEWRRLSDEEKQPYILKHEEEKERYLREKEEFNQRNSETGVEESTTEIDSQPPAKKQRKSTKSESEESEESKEVDDDDEETVAEDPKAHTANEDMKNLVCIATKDSETPAKDSDTAQSGDTASAKDLGATDGKPDLDTLNTNPGVASPSEEKENKSLTSHVMPSSQEQRKLGDDLRENVGGNQIEV